MSEHLVPAIKSLSLIHTIPLNEKLLVRDKLCLGHFCSSMLEPFFAFLKCRHQEQNERCISQETQGDTGDTAAHVNRGKAHQMWQRRNEPQTDRKTGTQQRQSSSCVVCSVLWDWAVQKTKMLLQTPLRAAFELAEQPALSIGSCSQSLAAQRLMEEWISTALFQLSQKI